MLTDVRIAAAVLVVLAFAASVACGRREHRMGTDAGVSPDAFVTLDARTLDAPLRTDGGSAPDAPLSPDGGPAPDAFVGDCLPDPSSSLCWQNPPSDMLMTWADAQTYCAGLGGGYRLPDIDELITFVRGCGATRSGCPVDDPSCLSLSCCDFAGCTEDAGPAAGCYWDPAATGTCFWYHSSSVVSGGPFDAWFIYFQDGSVQYGAQSIPKHVRCARDL
jgi:hypothetical protein